MNFTRKSNFSSIIVTKETSDGRSAKARRYSIPLNPIDNTIQLTNGWRLADIRLHIFRFEITRNILSIKPGTFQLEKLPTDELLPKMKESAGFIWLTGCLVGSQSQSQYRPARLKHFNKNALWNLVEVEVVLHCMTNKVGRKKVKLTWIPTGTTLNQSNHTGYYPISSGGADCTGTLTYIMGRGVRRGGEGRNRNSNM